MRKLRYKQSELMSRYSTLAGPLQPASDDKPDEIRFKSLWHYDAYIYRIWTRFVAYGALLLVTAYDIVLFNPSHWLIKLHPDSPLLIENGIMLACLIILQVFLFISSISVSRSTLRAKDPIPLIPMRSMKVAFVTTRAPGEPVSLVQNTLEAAMRIKYTRQNLDVWLLDETNDPVLQNLCRQLGVRHFSRHGIAHWNTIIKARPLWKLPFIWAKEFILHAVLWTAKPDPATTNPVYAARSKHGNLNSWLAYLAENDIAYDILAGVDTDQVPEPNYLERLLGYFRDLDVAYVVGPQVYGNYKAGLSGLVARWAESQSSIFQSTIQRAGNFSASPMFVGTNYAVRVDVLRQIGGFQPCITEDMATGLAIHSSRNPASGARWKSVYTPDVLAVGEGPDFWAPYFTQQWRWAAGIFDTWRRMVWRVGYKLSLRAAIYYFLMLTYYPMVAITWLLSIVSSLIYLSTGATAIVAPWGQFISLYIMTLVMQLSLYFWNRRYNVSPHEPGGSLGVPGMVLSTLTTPIYLSALIGIIMGKRPNFVVTSKGGGENPDWISTFRTHLQWAAVIAVGLLYGILHGHRHPAMLVWTGLQLVICLVPVSLGMTQAIRSRYKVSKSSQVLRTYIPKPLTKSGELHNV